MNASESKQLRCDALALDGGPGGHPKVQSLPSLCADLYRSRLDFGVGSGFLLGLQISGLREEPVSDRCRGDVRRPGLAACLL